MDSPQFTIRPTATITSGRGIEAGVKCSRNLSYICKPANGRNYISRGRILFSLQPAQKIRRTDDWNASKSSQRQQMFFVAGHDEIRFRRQCTFQNHFVIRVRSSAGRAFGWENQCRGLGQRIRPGNKFAPGIFQTKFFNRFVIFGKQRRADYGFATAFGPRRQAVKRPAAPETRAGHDVRVEDNTHYLRRLRTI